MLGLTTKRERPAEGARQIKAWAREIFDPEGRSAILVSELTCTEPGCPPIETVVAILRGPGDTTQYKIHKPLASVTRDDLARLSGG